jgi:hypothetical protein
MTTRTVKILGLAYGSTPAEISVSVDGATVYSGTVTTVDTSLPALPDLDLSNTTVEFCNFELPMDFSGTKPMTCSVTSGLVIFYHPKLTIFGTTYFLGEIAIILGLVYIELNVMSAIKKSNFIDWWKQKRR